MQLIRTFRAFRYYDFDTCRDGHSIKKLSYHFKLMQCHDHSVSTIARHDAMVLGGLRLPGDAEDAGDAEATQPWASA